MNSEHKILSRQSLLFDQPRRIIFGPNSVEQHLRSEVKRLGARNILLVTDEGVSKAGLSGRIERDLEKQEDDGSVRVTTYDRISAEPTMDSVKAASEFARSGSFDCVVAVGGGSVMDTAKMMANVVTNPGDPAYYLDPSEDRFKKPSLPKILVPTTAGTGSEVSNYSVVIDKSTMYKTWAASSGLLAEVAIVDPTMTLSCPSRVTAGAGLDVAGHCLEGLISREAVPISDCQALEGVRLLFGSLRKAYHGGDDVWARSAVSMAAMLGGIVIAYPWVGGPAILGHCIAEALGPRYRVPHGVMVGICLPYILAFNLPACSSKLAYAAPSLGIDTSSMDADEAAASVPGAVLKLMEDVELPRTLKEVNVPKSDLPSFAEYLVNERQFVYNLPKYNPRKLSLENVARLLSDMFEGALEK